MLPQHEGVPHTASGINKPLLIVFLLVVLTGLMLSAMLFLQAEPGDVAAMSRFKLCFAATILLSIFILIAGAGHLLHPHLWKSRTHKHGSRHHRSHRHDSHRHRSREKSRRTE